MKILFQFPSIINQPEIETAQYNVDLYVSQLETNPKSTSEPFILVIPGYRKQTDVAI